MAEDINRVVLIGRLTRDGELVYTNTGFAILKFSLAVNRRRKQGDEWVDEGNFFDANLFGKRGEALVSHMTKGKRVAIEGQLRQDRWESSDGTRRSKVIIDTSNVQLLGSREGSFTQAQEGGWTEAPHDNKIPDSKAPDPAPVSDNSGMNSFEDDIPF